MEWLNTQLASWWTTSEADKSPEQGHKPTHDLQKDDTLSKDQLLAFFEAGKVQLHSQAFRQKLKDAYLLRQVKPCYMIINFAFTSQLVPFKIDMATAMIVK